MQLTPSIKKYPHASLTLFFFITSIVALFALFFLEIDLVNSFFSKRTKIFETLTKGLNPLAVISVAIVGWFKFRWNHREEMKRLNAAHTNEIAKLRHEEFLKTKIAFFNEVVDALDNFNIALADEVAKHRRLLMLKVFRRKNSEWLKEQNEDNVYQNCLSAGEKTSKAFQMINRLIYCHLFLIEDLRDQWEQIEQCYSKNIMITSCIRRCIWYLPDATQNQMTKYERLASSHEEWEDILVFNDLMFKFRFDLINFLSRNIWSEEIKSPFKEHQLATIQLERMERNKKSPNIVEEDLFIRRRSEN